MSGDTTICIVGNLVAEPELRFTNGGKPVASFTIASTPRVFDRNTNDWKDQETLFLRCSLWGQAAENAAESLGRGQRVIAQGRLRQRAFEARDGEKRTVVELDVEEIGPSLRNATAKIVKAQRSQQGHGGQSAASDDPWAANPPTQTEAPF